MTHDALEALQSRLGHRFASRALLERALTHPSSTSPDEADYQRMEFLGDRVLALAIAEHLYATRPRADEGDMARRLNALVKRETCAKVAGALDLGAVIRLGGGEVQTGGRRKTAILADVCEAIIAAVFLDAGWQAARDVVLRHFLPFEGDTSLPLRDAKTTLQEWLQARGRPMPRYVTIDRSGPDHAPRFTIAVEVDGEEAARGRGTSKRAAEQDAATAYLVAQGIWKDETG